MNLGRFLHMRLQGAGIDTPVANDLGSKTANVATFGATGMSGLGKLGGLFGNKQGSTDSTINSAPWEPLQPYLLDLFKRGQDQSQSQQAPETVQAQQLQTQRALAGSPLNQAAQGQAMSTINGDYTDLSKNPAAKSAMDAARGQINSQFTGDNYGNSAHQEWLGKGIMAAASPFYESERNRQMQATALAPTLANQDYTDIGLLGQVGAQKQAFPWQNLAGYQQLLSGVGGGSSTTTQPYFSNPLGGIAGGAMAGGAIGGPWGAAIGGGLGLLAGR